MKTHHGSTTTVADGRADGFMRKRIVVTPRFSFQWSSIDKKTSEIPQPVSNGFIFYDFHQGKREIRIIWSGHLTNDASVRRMDVIDSTIKIQNVIKLPLIFNFFFSTNYLYNLLNNSIYVSLGTSKFSRTQFYWRFWFGSLNLKWNWYHSAGVRYHSFTKSTYLMKNRIHLMMLKLNRILFSLELTLHTIFSTTSHEELSLRKNIYWSA